MSICTYIVIFTGEDSSAQIPAVKLTGAPAESINSLLSSSVLVLRREPDPKISAAHRRGNYGLASDCIARRRRGLALADFLGELRPNA